MKYRFRGTRPSSNFFFFLFLSPIDFWRQQSRQHVQNAFFFQSVKPGSSWLHTVVHEYEMQWTPIGSAVLLRSVDSFLRFSSENRKQFLEFLNIISITIPFYYCSPPPQAVLLASYYSYYFIAHIISNASPTKEKFAVTLPEKLRHWNSKPSVWKMTPLQLFDVCRFRLH